MSNLETLLTAWLNDGEVPEDFQPETRIEEYLVAILEGVDDDVDPKSRADVLLDAIATKYAGYADGIDDLRNALGFPGKPFFHNLRTPKDIATGVVAINSRALLSLEEKGVTGVAENTIAITDAIQDIPQGGAELNIAFGDTAPEDTTKLWVKVDNPPSVTVDYNPDNTVETVTALSTVLPRATNMLACGTVGKKIYLFGGGEQYWFEFDVDTKIVTQRGRKGGLGRVACGVVGTKIYLFGGDGEHRIEVYDTENDSFTTASATFPQYTITQTTCAVVGTKCYIFGGIGEPTRYATTETYDTIFVYDTETDTLTKLAATLPTAARIIPAGVVGTKIYLFGGRNGETTLFDTINVFDTTTNTIRTLPVTLSPVTAQQSVATIGSKCYLIGGLTPSGGARVSIDTISVFDAETETLTTLDETLPQPFYSAGVGMVGNDAYLFGGGSTQLGNIPIDTIYKFNITFPLAEGDVFIQEDMLRNKFDLLTSPTKVTVGVAAVSVGNSSGYAEDAEAYLHDGTQWQQI